MVKKTAKKPLFSRGKTSSYYFWPFNDPLPKAPDV